MTKNQAHFFKILFALLLIPVLTFSSFSTASAVLQNNDLTFKQSAHSMQFAAGTTSVWIVEDDTIWAYDTGSDNKKAVCKANGIEHIAAFDAIYFSYLSEQKICSIDYLGNEYARYALPENMAVQQIEAIGGAEVLLLASESAGQEMSVYTSNEYQTELMNIPGWDNRGLSTIAVYDDYLYAYSASNNRLSAINLYTKTVVYPPVTVTGIRYMTGAQKGYVYALMEGDENHIWLVNLQTGETERINYTLPGDCVGLRRTTSSIITANYNCTQIYSIPVEKLAGVENTLTILNATAYQDALYMKKAIELFHERYPNIEILFKNNFDPRVVNTGVMAGAPGYDIICVQENMEMICSPLRYKAGAIVDLMDYEEITSLLPYYVDFFSPVMADDHMLGVPAFITPVVWSVNEELMKKLGVEVPRYGWMWDDFFALGDQVAAYNDAHPDAPMALYKEAEILPYLLTQYSNNTVDTLKGTAQYDSEVLINALEKWKGLCERGMIKFGVGENEPEGTALITMERMYYSDLQSKYIILPPSFDETTRYVTYMCAFEVCAGSPKKEESVYLLSCLLNPEVTKLRYVWETGPVLKDASAYKDSPDAGSINNSKENEELWMRYLANSVQYYFIGDMYRDQWQVLYPQFISGEITAEQFAQTCQRRADMVLGE